MLYSRSEFRFSLMTEQCSTVWTDHILLIHSYVNGHSVCFCFLAIMNKASVNMGRQVSIRVPIFNSVGFVPRRGIAGSCGNPCLAFEGPQLLF